MKKVHFYLRKTSSHKQTIYLCVRKGKNASYRKSLSFQILPTDWDKKKMRLKNKAKCRDNVLINNYLDELESSLIHFFHQKIINKEEITLADVKTFVLKLLYPEKSPEKNFLTFFRSYLKSLDTKLSCITGKPLAKSTVEKYQILYKLLKEYKTLSQKSMFFSDIDLEFYNNFVMFLQSKGYANNTIGKYISAVKSVLNDAFIKGVSQNMTYKNHLFKSLNESVQSIYLTKKDLNKLLTLDLPPRLDNSRKMFLVGCYTGLRYSDFSRITADNISHGMIKINQQKTGSCVVIPLHSYIKGIISQVETIKSVSNVQLNKNIKSICRIAGLKDKIITQSTKGGKLETQIKEKWQLVCTHTARRSFATNLYLDGVPAITIMKITGHRSESAFLRYIKISQEENARLLEKYWKNPKHRF